MQRRTFLQSILPAAAAAPLAAQTGSAARSGAAVENRRGQSFDDGWRFLRGDAPGAESPQFDDAAWRALDLPHDFSVEDLPPRAADANGEGTLWGTAVLPTRVGPFDTEWSAGGRDTGWFVGGTGWYRKRFSAAAVPAGAQVEISVEDEGPGIPEAGLEHIFDRFYSERPQGEHFGQHSGLGLSICRQIVEALKGRISAENRRDDSGRIVGARIIVRLPAAAGG